MDALRPRRRRAPAKLRRPRGRPPSKSLYYLPGEQPPRPAHRPKTLTAEDLQGWLLRIEALRAAYAAKHGARLSARQAIRVSMTAWWLQKLEKDLAARGVHPNVARELAVGQLGEHVTRQRVERLSEKLSKVRALQRSGKLAKVSKTEWDTARIEARQVLDEVYDPKGRPALYDFLVTSNKANWIRRRTISDTRPHETAVAGRRQTPKHSRRNT